MPSFARNTSEGSHFPRHLKSKMLDELEKVEMLEDKLNEAVNENIKLSEGMDEFS